MLQLISQLGAYEAIYITVLVYLTEISNGADEDIYIIFLLYLTEISNGAYDAIYITLLQLGTPEQ
jgi:hypothetical protein